MILILSGCIFFCFVLFVCVCVWGGGGVCLGVCLLLFVLVFFSLPFEDGREFEVVSCNNNNNNNNNCKLSRSSQTTNQFH